MNHLIEIAALITAIAVLITSITSSIVSVINAKRIEDTHSMVKSIDTAVNSKKPGEQSISSQVDDLHREIPAK